jgi:hypothetical protein
MLDISVAKLESSFLSLALISKKCRELYLSHPHITALSVPRPFLLSPALMDAAIALYERLKDCLEDNAWVWHNMMVGPFGRHLYFVTLHPQQGIVVLEARDYGWIGYLRYNPRPFDCLKFP